MVTLHMKGKQKRLSRLKTETAFSACLNYGYATIRLFSAFCFSEPSQRSEIVADTGENALAMPLNIFTINIFHAI